MVAAEGLTTLVKQGVPVDKALEAINAASGRSLVTEERIPDHVLSGAFDFGFAMNLMNKDVGICIAQLDANQLEYVRYNSLCARARVCARYYILVFIIYFLFWGVIFGFLT